MLAHHMSFPQKQTLLFAASDYWNARSANGTLQALERAIAQMARLRLLERAQRKWNAASSGTREAQMARRRRMARPLCGYWNAAKRHTLTLKCVNFVNFVNFL